MGSHLRPSSPNEDYTKEKKIHGFQASRSGPPISHLLFADDSLLFCKATEEEAINISKILKTYQKAPGQEINYTKSAISFGKGAHDSAYWMYSKTGAYAVKTGYHIQKAIDKENIHNQVLLERVQQGLADTLPFYLGWRLWKMRNKAVYENKRDHIIQVIHAAMMDKQLWEEAQSHNSVNGLQHYDATQVQVAFPLSSLLHTLPQRIDYFCIVDASWKSPEEQAGIGWSLTCTEGTPRPQGSSAIEPTSSSLVAEAMAMLLAVQQAQRLRYDNVTFIGDCGELFKCLKMEAMEGRMHATHINEATSIVKDIVNIAKQNSFSFYQVPRYLVVTADQLAKKARWNRQQYVITWH